MAHNSGPTQDPVGVSTVMALDRLGASANIKKAYLEQSAQWRDLAPVCYADHDRRGYPIHEPFATVISAAAFLANGRGSDEIGNRIKNACENYGISYIWDEFTKRAAAAVPPPPAPPTRFALGDRYPIDTPGRVKQAADYLLANVSGFVPTDLRTYAQNVLAAADPQTLGFETRDRVEKLAGYGRPIAPPYRIFGPYKIAAKNAGQDSLATALERLEDAVTAGGDPYPVVGLLNKMAGQFKVPLPDPELLIALTPIRAKEAVAALAPGPDGSWYRREDLVKVPAVETAALFDTGPFITADKVASLLATYGQPFATYLADHGIDPVVPPRTASPKHEWTPTAH